MFIPEKHGLIGIVQLPYETYWKFRLPVHVRKGLFIKPNILTMNQNPTSVGLHVANVVVN